MIRHLVFAGVLLFSVLGAPGARAQSAPGAKAPSNPGQPALSEDQKIEALIQCVEASGLGFVRNGTEYDSKKAAEHLRSKWNYARKRPRLAGSVATARDFIKNIASGSSMSGKPYQIVFKDGRRVNAGDWLTGKLEALEKTQPAGRQAAK